MKASLMLQKEIEDKQGTAACLGNIAVIHELQGDYGSAIDYNTECLKLMEELGNKGGIANVLNNMGIIYDLQEDFEKAKSIYEEALEIQKELGSKQGISGTLNNLGGIYAKLGSHIKAIDHYKRSILIQKEIGNDKGVANAYSNIGTSFKNLGDYDSALYYYNKSISIEEHLNNKKGLANTLNLLGQLNFELGQKKLAIQQSEKALMLAREIGSIIHTRDASKVLYKCYKATGNQKKALEMHELHILMKDSVLSEENQRDLIHQEYQYIYEKNALADSLEYAQKEAIKDLEFQKQEAEISRQRTALIGSLGGGVLLILLVITVLRGKKRSDNLLLNILPEETAKELKEKGTVNAKLISQVTVLFTDFKDFTSISENMAPEALVMSIHHCFSTFDEIMERHGVEKIKTIGDSYMAAGGLPTTNQTHASDVADAALEIMSFINDFNEEQNAKGERPFEIRIGMNTGPVVAGIVGVKKFQYDIWGDTVNTASRMESSSEAGKINISKTTYELLRENPKYQFESRGKILIKGKQKQEMFYLSLS